MSEQLFPFAQFEFPWALGPTDGRYVMRDGQREQTHVIVLATLGAPQRRRLRRRRPRGVDPQPSPTPVATARATVIDTAATHADERAAQAWLDGGQEAAEVETARALQVLNSLLAAHRVAAADPYARGVAATQALVARLGYGAGEQVADGRWAAAVEVDMTPHQRTKRVAALRPQERLAALAAGRETVLPCEELTLRARLDLDEGRPGEAALQLRVALEAALADLRLAPGAANLDERLDELRDLRGRVGDAANAALIGPLDDETAASVEEVLQRIEAALRARSAAGIS